MIVSPIAVAGMIFTGLVSFGVPLAVVLLLRRKTGHAVRAALVGALCFVGFALVLEQIAHFFMIPQVINIPWLYVVYGCLAAGVFEETGRLVGLKILCRKNARVSTGMAYGIGHGGIEAILTAGIASIANLSFVLTYSVNNTSVLVKQTAELMQNTPTYHFWIGGVERISAMALHFALSILICMVVTKRVKFYWYFAAIAMHGLTNAAAGMMQIGLLHSIGVVEMIVALAAAACCALVAVLYVRTRGIVPELPPEEKPVKDVPLFEAPEAEPPQGDAAGKAQPAQQDATPASEPLREQEESAEDAGTPAPEVAQL